MFGKKKPVIALYGSVQLTRAWCDQCETNAIVLGGLLQCCNSPVSGKPTEQVRMSNTPTLDREEQDRIRKQQKDNGSERSERLKQNGGSHTLKEWKALCKKYGYMCLACGERKTLTEDHIIPVVLGGTDDIENIQPLCMDCNSKKRARYIDYRPRFS